jgi:hypothetical protein
MASGGEGDVSVGVVSRLFETPRAATLSRRDHVFDREAVESGGTTPTNGVEKRAGHLSPPFRAIDSSPSCGSG